MDSLKYIRWKTMITQGLKTVKGWCVDGPGTPSDKLLFWVSSFSICYVSMTSHEAFPVEWNGQNWCGTMLSCDCLQLNGRVNVFQHNIIQCWKTASSAWSCRKKLIIKLFCKNNNSNMEFEILGKCEKVKICRD